MSAGLDAEPSTIPCLISIFHYPLSNLCKVLCGMGHHNDTNTDLMTKAKDLNSPKTIPRMAARHTVGAAT